jgi:ankyrin repeat protein
MRPATHPFPRQSSNRDRGEVIALLREHGADPARENNYGVSPLKLAHTVANFDVRQFVADLSAPEGD